MRTPRFMEKFSVLRCQFSAGLRRELKTRSLAPRRQDPEMSVRLRGGDAASGGALQKPGLQEVGLVQIFERALVLAERGRDRVDPDRSPVALLDDRGEDPA